MNEAYYNATANEGGLLVTFIALVDGTNAEVSATRQPVTWTAAAGGLIRPTANLDFDIGAGNTVAGWVGFSAATGGTNYGGADVPAEVFNQAGSYRLLASETSITHKAPV